MHAAVPLPWVFGPEESRPPGAEPSDWRPTGVLTLAKTFLPFLRRPRKGTSGHGAQAAGGQFG
jgi:hypothetical protein